MAHEKNEEQILREMQQTRDSLTEKLETLEKKVVGTVENATSAVNETVGAIKETVHDTVATVNESVKGGVESVKGALDVPAHVQEHPWLMVGGSVAVGYVLGTMLTPKAEPRYAPQPMQSFHAMPTTPTHTPASRPSEASTEGMFGQEIAKVKKLALGVLFGAAREWLRASVPEHLGDKIEEIVDSVTKKAGGEPVPSEDFDKWTSPSTEEPREEEAAASQPSRPAKEHGNGHAAPRRW